MSGAFVSIRNLVSYSRRPHFNWLEVIKSFGLVSFWHGDSDKARLVIWSTLDNAICAGKPLVAAYRRLALGVVQ
jgi:hypothetical protein